jgi:hypothetical protein
VVDEPASPPAVNPAGTELGVEGVEDLAAHAPDRKGSQEREDVGADQTLVARAVATSTSMTPR